MILVSRIIHAKEDRSLNVTNKFKYQRRLPSRLAIVMFRGTLCSLIVRIWITILNVVFVKNMLDKNFTTQVGIFIQYSLTLHT